MKAVILESKEIRMMYYKILKGFLKLLKKVKV